MNKQATFTAYFESTYDYSKKGYFNLEADKVNVMYVEMELSDELLSTLPKSFRSRMNVSLSPTDKNPINEAGLKKIRRVLRDADSVKYEKSNCVNAYESLEEFKKFANL